MQVVVFGSINMDLVVRTQRLPAAGETIRGNSFFTAPGGKGANQAVACARLGAPTSMVGRVGGDAFGTDLLRGLAENQVDISGIITDPDQSSGVALIAVDEDAENTIIIVPGANGAFNREDIDRLEASLSKAKVLLLQLEIPMEYVEAAIERAHQLGVTVILDPAPAQSIPERLYPWIDVLTPNETEAAILVDFPLKKDHELRKAAEVLLDRGAKRVVIKLGSRGAYYAEKGTGEFYPAYPVKAVDSVAAGDAFNGALGAALSEGKPFEEALHWGMAAGALSTTKAGAQPSMPYRQPVLGLIGTRESNGGN